MCSDQNTDTVSQTPVRTTAISFLTRKNLKGGARAAEPHWSSLGLLKTSHKMLQQCVPHNRSLFSLLTTTTCKMEIPGLALFRNKSFMLNEMTRRNASKFAIFYIYENPKLLFHFSFRATLLFPLINALVYVDIRP